MDLKAAGFSDAEIAEYQKLQQAGFTPEEIQAHYAQNAAQPLSANVAAGYGSERARQLADQNIPWFDPKNTSGTGGAVMAPPADTIPALASGGTAKQGPESAGANPPIWPEISHEAGNKFLRESADEMMKNPMLMTPGPAAAPDKTFEVLKDLLTRGVPNAAKWAAGKIGNVGQFPQRLAGRYLNRPPNSKAVETVWEEGIPITHGNTAEVTKAKANEAWAPVPPLIDEAAKAGQTVPRAELEAAVNTKLDKIAGKTVGGKGSEKYQKAASWLDELGKEPEQIPIDRAEKLKEGLGKEIRDWAAPDVKDEAQRPIISVKKAARRALPEAIAERTSNPEAVLDANEKYGLLAKLLNKRGEFSPAERADVYASKRGLYEHPRDVAEEYLSRILYKMQKAGKNLKEAPTDLGGPGPLDNMFKPGGGKPPKPGTPEDGWQYSTSQEGSLGDDLHPSTGSMQRRVHPDWFDELEASPTARRMGENIDSYVLDQPVATDFHPTYDAQMHPNVPEVEPTPGTLMEGEVPSGFFTQPEGWGSIPEQPSFVHELGPNRPPNVMPDTETYPGTLMEGEVPLTGFQKAKGAKRARKGK